MILAAQFQHDRVRKRVNFTLGAVRVSLGADWTRPCPLCGGVQKIELRSPSPNNICDQPRCSSCRQIKASAPTPPTIVYGVEWIEIEFDWGERDGGWVLYLDKAECFRATREASKRGPANNDYIGPVRPLVAFEIPFGLLGKKLQQALLKSGSTHTDNHWAPPRGKSHAI